MKSYCIYTKEKNEACLQVQAEMASDPDFPRNFDCCITIMSDWNSQTWMSKRCSQLPLDEQMLKYYPEEYGNGDTDLVDAGYMSQPIRPYAVILVYFLWSNVNGDKGNSLKGNIIWVISGQYLVQSPKWFFW